MSCLHTIYRFVLAPLLTLLLPTLCYATVYQGTGPQASNIASPLGMNLREPDSWSPSYYFIDAALMARKWIPHECDKFVWDNGSTIVTDSNGWVTKVDTNPAAGTVTCPGMFLLDEEDGAALHYVPLGTYVVIWEGEGTLRFGIVRQPQATCKTTSCKVEDGSTVSSVGAGPHKATFTLSDPDFIRLDLQLRKFSATAPVKNIRIIMPGGYVVTGNKIDYFSYCKTNRGPNGPAPTGALEPRDLNANQTCRDFETVYWDRFKDSLSLIHRYTDVSISTQPPKGLFHPLTLKNLRNVRLLRAVEWMHANNTSVKNWSQRTNYKHQNQTTNDQGPALEYVVSLADILGADLWVNIPYMAAYDAVTNSRDYVRQFASFLASNLHPNLRLYVEYSNEIWNSGFPQAAWVEQQGVAKYPPPTTPFEARLRFQADQATKFADVFTNAFKAKPSRLVNVIAGQAANSYVGQTLLGWNSTARHFAAYAIAPYLGSLINNSPPAVTNLDNLFNTINQDSFRNISGSGALDWVEQNMAMVASINRQFGTNVRTITYELGQHLVSYDNRYTDLYIAANRDARMGSATTSYLCQLNALKARGLGELTYFNDVFSYRASGSWGAKEVLQLATPKSNAVQAFIDRQCR